jgi:hypothetical protein
VLLVGTGGLGSPLALYLAAAGVGTIGLVDDDVVDASNLQRQIIHGTSDIGTQGGVGPGQSILEINPFVTVVEHRTFLTSDNALEIIRRLRPRHRRDRQLPDALSRQRRVRAARQAERLRLDLPVRGAAERVLGRGGPVLPLHVPRAPATGHGPQLRRRRRARHHGRAHRHRAGHRGHQADHRHW